MNWLFGLTNIGIRTTKRLINMMQWLEEEAIQ